MCHWLHDQRKRVRCYFHNNEPFLQFGAGEMNRTPDLLITNELSQWCIGVDFFDFLSEFSSGGFIVDLTKMH